MCGIYNPNPNSRYDAAFRFKYRYTHILNDVTAIALSNFGSMGNVLISDFCGDPEVWSGQKFKPMSLAAGANAISHHPLISADGRSLVSLVIYINKKKFAGTEAENKLFSNGLLTLSKATGPGTGKDFWTMKSMDSDPHDPGRQDGTFTEIDRTETAAEKTEYSVRNVELN